MSIINDDDMWWYERKHRSTKSGLNMLFTLYIYTILAGLCGTLEGERKGGGGGGNGPNQASIINRWPVNMGQSIMPNNCNDSNHHCNCPRPQSWSIAFSCNALSIDPIHFIVYLLVMLQMAIAHYWQLAAAIRLYLSLPFWLLFVQTMVNVRFHLSSHANLAPVSPTDPIRIKNRQKCQFTNDRLIISLVLVIGNSYCIPQCSFVLFHFCVCVCVCVSNISITSKNFWGLTIRTGLLFSFTLLLLLIVFYPCYLVRKICFYTLNLSMCAKTGRINLICLGADRQLLTNGHLLVLSLSLSPFFI